MTNLGTRNETLEFKEGKKQLDKGVKTLSAMLNSYQGGTVYFGVNESGDIIGLDLCDTIKDKIAESIMTYIRPQIEPRIEILTSDDGLQYICLTANSSSPIYSFDDRYYIRDGTSNVIASPEELIHLATSCGTSPQPSEKPDSEISDGLSPNLKKVFNHLKKNKSIKLSEVSKKTGISLSSVKKYVLELKRLGYVDNEGTNRNSVWVIKK